MNSRTITLVERITDCGNITKEDFAQSMRTDVENAIKQYNEWYTPEYKRTVQENIKRSRWLHLQAMTRYAEKWKTAARREKYINEEMTKFDEAHKNYTYYYFGIDFFDFKCDPSSIGLSMNCIIRPNKLDDATLGRCFEELKDNKYFKIAKGWQLTYTTYENSYRNVSRPQIKLILDETSAEQFKKAEDKLTKAVCEFYKHCSIKD